MRDARCSVAVLVCVACALAQARAAPPITCPPPQHIDLDAAPLANVAKSLKPGKSLAVLAVGSAIGNGPVAPITVDPAASPPPPVKPGTVKAGKPNAAAAPGPGGFPWEMVRALETSVPGLSASVTALGGRGLSAAQMLELIRGELAAHRYQLVLWQTGTVEAVRGDPAGDFYRVLADGAAEIAASGADLVLVDPQYSHFLESNANLAPYLSAMQAVGAFPGAILFHRYDVMRDWEDAGLIDLEHARKADRPFIAARLHTCLGRELARTLLADIAASSR